MQKSFNEIGHEIVDWNQQSDLEEEGWFDFRDKRARGFEEHC